MSRLGVFIFGTVLIVIMMRGIKPAMDGLYTIMNGTRMPALSITESVLWRAMPYIIPLILFGILVAFLTGKIGGHRDESGGEE